MQAHEARKQTEVAHLAVSGARWRTWQTRVERAVLYLFLTAGSLVMALPLIWMILTSFKTYEEANAPQLVWFPSDPQLTAYTQILQDADFLRAYANSIFVTALAVLGTLISVSAVAYAFSRIEWPGRNVVFFLMLSTMMIPFQALIVPQYVFFNKVGWIGTYNPLTIPGYFAGGAAMVVGHWNALLQPIIYLQTTKLYTLPVYVASLVNPQQTTQPWPTIMAASVLTALPLLLVFFVAQRYLISGIVLSGSKG